MHYLVILFSDISWFHVWNVAREFTAFVETFQTIYNVDPSLSVCLAEVSSVELQAFSHTLMAWLTQALKGPLTWFAKSFFCCCCVRLKAINLPEATAGCDRQSPCLGGALLHSHGGAGLSRTGGACQTITALVLRHGSRLSRNISLLITIWDRVTSIQVSFYDSLVNAH